jgi:hypothetical protein
MIQADGLYYHPIPDVSKMRSPAFCESGDMRVPGGFMTPAECTRTQTPGSLERRLEFPHRGTPIPVYTPCPLQVEMIHTASAAMPAAAADEYRYVDLPPIIFFTPPTFSS